MTDETVEALGKLSAALDHVEDARGHLYAFHRLMGSAESTLEEAEELIRKAGHTEIADAMDRELDEHIKASQREAEKNGILGHGLHHPFHTMFEDVFEELPWHLREQSEQAIRERQIKWPQ